MSILNIYEIMSHKEFESLPENQKLEKMYILTDDNGVVDEVKIINYDHLVIFRENFDYNTNNDFEPKLIQITKQKMGNEIKFPNVSTKIVEETDVNGYYFFSQWVDKDQNLAPSLVPNQNTIIYAKRIGLTVPKRVDIVRTNMSQTMLNRFIINSKIPLYFNPYYLGDAFELTVINQKITTISENKYQIELEFNIDCNFDFEGNTISFDASVPVYMDETTSNLLGEIELKVNVYRSDAPTGD